MAESSLTEIHTKFLERCALIQEQPKKHIVYDIQDDSHIAWLILNTSSKGSAIGKSQTKKVGKSPEEYYLHIAGCESPVCEICKTKSFVFESLKSGYRSFAGTCSSKCYRQTQKYKNARESGDKKAAASRKKTKEELGYDPAWTEETRARREATNISRHGSKSGFGKNAQLKAKETLRNRYGTSNPFFASEEAIQNWKLGCKKSKWRGEESRKAIVDGKSELVSEWTGIYSETIWECKSCNSRFSHFGLTPALCDICFPRGSRLESLVISELAKHLPLSEIETRNRAVLDGKEIDLYLKKYNVGIELDGLYWHSYASLEEEVSKSKEYKKYLKAKERGVLLMRFYEHEVHKKLPLVISMILAKCKIFKERYFARKLILDCEVSSKEAEAFFNENHISGFTSASYYYALRNNEGEIISMASFGNSRFSKSGNLELIRYASKKHTCVVGGFKKILNATKKLNRNIETYCDLRFSHANTYLSAGFSFIKYTGLNYYWWTGKNDLKIYTRYQTQKKKLEKVLQTFDETLSESENCFANGFRRFWDNGNIKLELLSYT